MWNDCAWSRGNERVKVEGSHSFLRCRRFKAHDLESGIHVEDISGDAAAQVAAQKNGGVGDFGDVGVATQRGVFLHEIENLREIFNATRGNRFDGTGGNRVDADFVCAQFGGEVTDFRFESGFGDAHDVVIFYDARGAQISEGHDCAAIDHQRRKGAGDGDQGIGADVEREFKAVARSFQERLVQIFVISECQAVDQDVKGAALLFEGFREAVNVGLQLDVAGEQSYDAEVVAEFLDDGLCALVLIGEQEGGAFAGEGLGDGVSDTPFIPNAENQSGLTFQ